MAQKETERLNQIMLGAALSRAVSSVAELGVADHIQPGSPRSVRDLAKATGAHEQSLHRVLRFLASHGLFQEIRNKDTNNGDFDHTPLSAALRSDAEGSYCPAARFFHRLFPGWDGLDHSLRTGQTGFDKVFGMPIFEYVGKNPELGPILDAGMTSIHGFETAAMLDAYDFSAVRTLADIGGGNGSLIASVLQRYPKMNGLLFDLGHVVARARERLKSMELADRCQVIEGSFFDTVPSGADSYLFRHVIHDWTDEQCIQILGHCRKVVPKEGRLLVVECVIPTGNDPSISKDFDMTMMTMPGGLERTEAEFRSLFKHSGFELTSVTPTSSMVSVIEGKPA
jgi:hypothetical protein